MSRRHEWVGLAVWCLVMVLLIEGMDAWLSRRTVLGSNGRQADAAAPGHTLVDEPDVVITGFQFLHTPPRPVSQPVWILAAGMAELFERQRVVVLRDIHATFRPERGSGDVVLTGERGRLDLQQMNFEVIGESRPLSLQLADQYRLTTTRLVWDNSAGLLTTDRSIRLTGRELTLTGTGLRWSMADGTLAILQDVETVIAPS